MKVVSRKSISCKGEIFLRLRDIASVIRSKNAGPFYITVDVILPDIEACKKVIESQMISRDNIARIYGMEAGNIEVITHEESNSIKLSMVRPQAAASFNDTDIYGTQQHIPILDLEIPD